MSAPDDSAGKQPAIDPAAIANLKEIGGGDPGFVQDLIVMFREDSPPRLAEIQAALERGDSAMVAKTSHSLKGSGSNFGAARFRELSQSIETAGNSGDISQVPALLGQLKGEFERVDAALTRALAEGL